MHVWESSLKLLLKIEFCCLGYSQRFSFLNLPTIRLKIAAKLSPNHRKIQIRCVLKSQVTSGLLGWTSDSSCKCINPLPNIV